MSQPPSLPRRRNGKPQACEPCRKRKMACDHTLPICRRCIQRKTSASCVYLPAPMTQKSPKDQAQRKATEIEVQPISLSLPVLNVSLTGLERPHSVDTPESQSTNGGTRSQGSYSNASPIVSHSAGFLGPTSFSAVFLENQRNLEYAIPNDAGLHGDQTVISLQYQSHIKVDDSFDARHIQLGMKVLSSLPDRDTCLILLSRCYLRHDGWLQPATKYCIDSLWSTFRSDLNGSRGAQGLEFVARVLCRNSKTQLAEQDDGEAWLSSFSGHQMRWEIIGIIFSCCTYGTLASKDNDPIFKLPNGKQQGQKEFMDQMREGVSLCVALCSARDMVNTIMLVLLYQNSVLQSVLGAGGDTSFLLWRHHADLVAVCTALGVHRDSGEEDSTTSIRIEMRRRVHACVYSIDKTLASFTGRPPFLSRRYSTCKMPLDISDEQLMLPKHELDQVVARLDSNGWNTDGQLYPATYARLTFLQMLIRDEILEIFLGNSKSGLVEINELKERSEEMYTNLPPMAQYYPMDEVNLNVNDDTLWIKISGRLRHVHNHFLLERMAIKHGQKNGQELLDISKETMALVLMIWTHRDRFVGRTYCYDWMVLSFGVPASGVLCVELLKHSKNLADANIPPSSQPRLPLSETVQNLSLFVAFLAWIRPSQPNYEICNRVRGIISRLLDQTLDGPVTDNGTTGGGIGGGVATWTGNEIDFGGVWAADFLDFDAVGQEDWGMLGSTEWTAPWIGLA